MLARALPAAVLATGAVLVPATPASAATTVLVSDNQFTPEDVVVGLGTQVEFVFTEGHHSATSDDGFWDTGVQESGTGKLYSFDSAGTFGYHCSVHLGMTGSVAVRPTATGAPGAGWTLRWATDEAPDTRDYDVQVRRAGSDRWRAFRTDTTRPTGSFDPRRAGTWRVRARSTVTDTGESSGWSPVRKVRVT